MSRIRTGPWNGDTLRTIRHAAGLSQQALADKIALEPECEKCHQTTIKAWEQGRAPSATYLAALARVLGLSMERLCAATDPVPGEPLP